MSRDPDWRARTARWRDKFAAAAADMDQQLVAHPGDLLITLQRDALQAQAHDLSLQLEEEDEKETA